MWSLQSYDPYFVMLIGEQLAGPLVRFAALLDRFNQKLTQLDRCACANDDAPECSEIVIPTVRE